MFLQKNYENKKEKQMSIYQKIISILSLNGLFGQIENSTKYSKRHKLKIFHQTAQEYQGYIPVKEYFLETIFSLQWNFFLL